MARMTDTTATATASIQMRSPVTSTTILLLIQSLLVLVAFCEDKLLSKNLALHRPTRQNAFLQDDQYSSESSNAVDGDLNTNFLSGGSCTHTGYLSPPHWWLVDLQEVQLITAVRITNRAEGYGHRLRNFSVEMTLTDPEELAGFPGSVQSSNLCFRQVASMPEGETILFNCQKPTLGRYVRLLKHLEEKSDRPINICEFEVYKLKQTQWYLSTHTIASQQLGGSNSLSSNLMAIISRPVSRIQCAVMCATNIALANVCKAVQFHVVSGECRLLLNVDTDYDDDGPMNYEVSTWLAYIFS